jgi:hypothetical protein
VGSGAARSFRSLAETVAGHGARLTLGVWLALGEVLLDGAEQRCWNHRLTNVIVHLLMTVCAATS